MKRNYSNALKALKKLGVPTYQRSDIETFQISAEDANSYKFCDYYAYAREDWDFGVSPTISDTLRNLGLFAEWVNPGRLSVYES